MKEHYLTLIAVMLLSISIVAAVPYQQSGIPINVSVTNPNVVPQVFLGAHSRVLTNDPYGVWENGNIQSRSNNYAFTGEQISFKALVFDTNGIQDISSVSGVLSVTQGGSPSKQVSCSRDTSTHSTLDFIGAPAQWDSNTMAVYDCIYTVEPNAYGNFWYRIQATDNAGSNGYANSQEYWFFNPALDIGITGAVNFGSIQPGQTSTSPAIVISNHGEGGMEVQFRISGTDFYDPASTGAMCPSSNKLALSNFRYSATQGNANVNDKPIPYGTSVTSSQPIINGVTTSSGADMSLTMKLTLPTPCKGTFTQGNIYLWSIAV